MKRLILSVTILVGLLLIVSLDRYQVSSWQEMRRVELTKEAEAMCLRLETSVESRINAARHLDSFVQASTQISEEKFTRYARRLLEYNRSLRALQLADEDTQVRYVYPPERNMISITDPMTLIEDPLRGQYVRKAIEERRMTVQPPFELRQGGVGIVARHPIFVSGTFAGLAIAVLDVPVIIDEAFPELLDSAYRLNLRDSAGTVFYETFTENNFTVSRQVSFADTYWNLELAFANGQMKPLLMSRLIVYGLGGGVLSLLVLLIFLLFGRAEHLEREVAMQSAELKRSEQRFRIVADYTNDWEYWILPDGTLEYVSPSVEDVTGYRPEVFHTGTDILETVVLPEDRDKIASHLYPNNDGAPAPLKDVLNLRIRTERGEIRWIGHHSQAVFLPDGTYWGLRASNRDVTEHVQLEANLKKMVEEKETLMKELNHRVKNNLALINSLVHLKGATLGKVVDLSDIAHQIDTIRIVHEKLYQTSRITHIDVDTYISELLESVFSFSGMPVEIDSTVKVDELPTKTAIPLGLIINEVATNAMKYSFVRGEPAIFSYGIEYDRERNTYIVTIGHSGGPFPDNIDFDHPETLGLRLIKELTAQLNGDVELARRPSPRITIRFSG